MVDRAAVLKCIDLNFTYLYEISKKLNLNLSTTSNILNDFKNAGLIVEIKGRRYRNRKRYRLTELGEEALKLKEHLEKEEWWVLRENLLFSPLCIESVIKVGLVEDKESKLTVFQDLIRMKTKNDSLYS